MKTEQKSARFDQITKFLGSLPREQAMEVFEVISRSIPPVIDSETTTDSQSIDLPGQVNLSINELSTPSKLKELRDWAKQNKKRVVIISSAVAGVVVIGVGAAYMFKHILDKNPNADITDF